MSFARLMLVVMTEVAARHWRLRDVRLGNREAWGEIVRRYKENNPHFALGQLSRLEEEKVEEVHERKRASLEDR